MNGTNESTTETCPKCGETLPAPVMGEKFNHYDCDTCGWQETRVDAEWLSDHNEVR